MPVPLVTPAIVLRAWPYGESDKIVSFFTENHGKLNGIAKGAKRSRRRFLNTLEPFSLVTLRFHDRPHGGLAFIDAADLVSSFQDLVKSLERIAHASYLVEITDGLTGDREENRPLFHHLKEGLTFLQEQGASLSFLTYFELKLLRLAGYQPMLERCRRCQKRWLKEMPAGWRFSPRDGGILCDSCATLRKEAIALSVESIAALADLQRTAELSDDCLSLSGGVLRESRAALLRFIQFQVSKELKSVPFLEAFSLI